MTQQMSLGGFVFGLADETGYDQSTRTTDGGWSRQPRYGQKPLSQNSGPQLDTRSYSGKWFGAPGMASLNSLRKLQADREPKVLTDGYGNNLGLWTIEKIVEKGSRIIDDGTIMVIDFTIDLMEYAGESTQ